MDRCPRAAATVATRQGIGYDFHRLVVRRPFVLAGVLVPFARGPLGHSDGDPLAHAVADAMLGSLGAGDIGELFPDRDPAFRGMAGLEIIRRTRAVARERGFVPVQVDTVVVCQAPALSPFRRAIVTALAGALGIDPGLVGLKFKTTEGLGPIGRGRAISAFAVVVMENQ